MTRGIALPEEQPLTARLAGAGSMVAELEHVLAVVPSTATADDYRHAILEGNAARKATGTARMWAWKRLKLRYALDQPEAPEFRSFQIAMRDPDHSSRRLSAMLMFARLDRLFREVTLEQLAPRLSEPGEIVDEAPIAEQVDRLMLLQGASWSAESRASMANHVASSWKDFGLVEGSKQRRVANIRVGSQTTRFAVELGKGHGLTDRQVLDSAWFRLLGMDSDGAQAALRSAARDGVLEFRSQADVVEIAVPGATRVA